MTTKIIVLAPDQVKHEATFYTSDWVDFPRSLRAVLNQDAGSLLIHDIHGPVFVFPSTMLRNSVIKIAEIGSE